MSEIITEISQEEKDSSIIDSILGTEKPDTITDDKKEVVEENPKEEEEKPVTEDKKTDEGSEETPKEVDLDDAALVALLKKRNINIDSLEELVSKKEPSPEDLEQSEAIKKLEIKKWAIETKNPSAKLLDEYDIESKLAPAEIVFKSYFEERKNETNPSTDEVYTEDELRAEFEEENFLVEDELDPRRVRAEKNIKLRADIYLKNKYSPIQELEQTYNIQEQTNKEKKFVSTTISTLKESLIQSGLSISFKDENGVDFDLKTPVNQKVVDEIVTDILEKGYRLSGDSSDDTSKLKTILESQYFLKNKESIIKEYATAYHSKKILELQAKNVGVDLRTQTITEKKAVGENKAIDSILESPIAKRILDN